MQDFLQVFQKIQKSSTIFKFVYAFFFQYFYYIIIGLQMEGVANCFMTQHHLLLVIFWETLAIDVTLVLLDVGWRFHTFQYCIIWNLLDICRDTNVSRPNQSNFGSIYLHIELCVTRLSNTELCKTYSVVMRLLIVWKLWAMYWVLIKIPEIQRYFKFL